MRLRQSTRAPEAMLHYAAPHRPRWPRGRLGAAVARARGRGAAPVRRRRGCTRCTARPPDTQAPPARSAGNAPAAARRAGRVARRSRPQMAQASPAPTGRPASQRAPTAAPATSRRHRYRRQRLGHRAGAHRRGRHRQGRCARGAVRRTAAAWRRESACHARPASRWTRRGNPGRKTARPHPPQMRQLRWRCCRDTRVAMSRRR